MTSSYILQVLIFLFVGTDISLCFDLPTTKDLAFSEEMLDFWFAHILNSLFNYVSDETSTLNLLIPKQEPNSFHHTHLYGQGVMFHCFPNPRLLTTEYHHYHNYCMC